MDPEDTKDDEVVACAHPAVHSAPLMQRPFLVLLGGSQKPGKLGDKNVDEGDTTPLYGNSTEGRGPSEGTVMFKFSSMGRSVLRMADPGEGGGGGQVQDQKFNARRVYERMDRVEAQFAQLNDANNQILQMLSGLKAPPAMPTVDPVLEKMAAMQARIDALTAAPPKSELEEILKKGLELQAQAIAAAEAQTRAQAQVAQQAHVEAKIEKAKEDWLDKVKNTTLGTTSFSEDFVKCGVQGAGYTAGVIVIIGLAGLGANALGVKSPWSMG